MQKQITEVERIKLDAELFKADVEQKKERLQKIDYAVEDVQNNIYTVENFVEKYIPLRVITQISEALNCVLQKPD